MANRKNQTIIWVGVTILVAVIIEIFIFFWRKRAEKNKEKQQMKNKQFNDTIGLIARSGGAFSNAQVREYSDCLVDKAVEQLGFSAAMDYLLLDKGPNQVDGKVLDGISVECAALQETFI